MAKVRRFEFTDATSNKFWQIDTKGNATWGKIGSSADVNGDGPTKHYDAAEALKTINSKLAKG